MKIIALSGKAESGKDWLTRHVLLPRGYFQISFADQFKIGAIGKGFATYEEAYVTKPAEVRNFLQDEGTKRGRDLYGKDIWINTAFAWMHLFEVRNGIDKFVVADVRFRNEADAIRRKGGIVIRIDAPSRSAGSKLTPEQRAHESETDLDNYSFDYRVFDDCDDDTGVRELESIITMGNVLVGR